MTNKEFVLSIYPEAKVHVTTVTIKIYYSIWFGHYSSWSYISEEDAWSSAREIIEYKFLNRLES